MKSRVKEPIFSGLWSKGQGCVPLLILLGVLVGSIFLGGCAARPLKEISEAERALGLAHEAGAQRYAPLSLKSAEEALNTAQKLTEAGDYRKARSWAMESQQKAKIAKEEAVWAQEKFKKEAVNSLDEAEKALSRSEKEGRVAPPIVRELELAKETIKRAKLALELNSYEEARDLALLAKNQAQGLMEAAKKAEEEAARQAEKERKGKRSLEALNQGVTSYKVKYGETLWMIAGYAEIYNDPLLWPIIYKANRDQIRDPEVIFADQLLKIPRNITEEQRSAAIKESSEGTWFKHSTMGDKGSYFKQEP